MALIKIGPFLGNAPLLVQDLDVEGMAVVNAQKGNISLQISFTIEHDNNRAMTETLQFCVKSWKAANLYIDAIWKRTKRREKERERARKVEPTDISL